MNFITKGNQEVVIGAGELYALPVSEITDVFALTATEEAKLTYLGYIEANAILKSEIEKVDLISANAGKFASVVKDKKVSFTTGIMEWHLGNISKFLTGSSYTLNEETGKSTFVYAREDKVPDVYLRFVGTDESAAKKITMTMFTCSFTGTLNFDFNREKAITFDYSFDVFATKNPTTQKHLYYSVTCENITTESTEG